MTTDTKLETPRTDSFYNEYCLTDKPMDDRDVFEFAQTLERELTAMTAERDLAREENVLLSEVSRQAQMTLLVSIRDDRDLPVSLGLLSIACKAHYDWRTSRIAAFLALAAQEPKT